MQGDNAWVFATEDNVAACVKAFLEFEKALVADIPKDKRKSMPKPTEITGTPTCCLSKLFHQKR